MRFEWFGGAPYLTGALEEYRQGFGARLLAVGGKPIEGVLRVVDRAIAKGESPGWTRFLESVYLSRPVIVNALGITASLETATFVLE